MPARLASVLVTAARCFASLICTSGVPVFTRCPAFTKMRVTIPSTSGWIVVDRSDRIVAMNSEASSIGLASSVRILTADGGGAAPRPAPARCPTGTAQQRQSDQAHTPRNTATGAAAENANGSSDAMGTSSITWRREDPRVAQAASNRWAMIQLHRRRAGAGQQKKRTRKRPRQPWPSQRAVKTGLNAARSGELALLEAFPAEHRAPLGRSERNRRLFPAGRAVRRRFDALSGGGPPAAGRDARLALQLLHRLGSFLKFLSAKNSCSPAVQVNSVPQSTHVNDLSWNSIGPTSHQLEPGRPRGGFP